MSLLLDLVARFSRSISRTFRPAVFFSSTATLFDNKLSESQEFVRDELKKRGFPDHLHTTASNFRNEDLDLLKVSFEPALQNEVLPDIEDTFSCLINKYALPEIDRKTITAEEFDVENHPEISDDDVRSFAKDLNRVAANLRADEGMDESKTDRLIMDLLVRVVEFHKWPLSVSPHPPCCLCIFGEPYVTAKPEYVVDKGDIFMIVVEDKHIKNKNLNSTKSFGEAQLAAEILTCADENKRRMESKPSRAGVIPDQTIFGLRAVSTYFTFYKAVIHTEYWKELEKGLPTEQSLVVKRWPGEDVPRGGLDIAEPKGRREILMAFSKLRRFLLNR